MVVGVEALLELSGKHDQPQQSDIDGIGEAVLNWSNTVLMKMFNGGNSNNNRGNLANCSLIFS